MTRKTSNRYTAKNPAVTGAAGGVSLSQRLRAANRWREQYNPLRGLTLSRAVQLAEAYFRGEMADLQWTYFWIEQTDPDLLALIECRLGRLLEMDYHIKVAEDADEKLATEQQDYLRGRFDAIDNLYEGVEHFGMAPFRGFAHCEKWISGGELTHLEIVDQWNAIRDGMYGAWKYNPEARNTTFRALPEENVMEPEAFLFRQVRRPINRIALFKFVRSNLSDKDWDGFNEIYGIPGGVVIGPSNVPEGKEADYESAAQEIAEGGSGYLPNGSDYKPNVAPRGSQPFKERLDHLSEKLVLAGTGGKLTMLTESGSGTLAGGAHAEVFEQIAKGDARRISETFNKQLVETWLNEKFPGQPHVAYFELAANEEADVGQIVEHAAKLSQAGFLMDAEQLSEKTGYTLTVKPAAPLALPGAPAGEPITNRASAAAAGRAALFNANAAKAISGAQLAAVRPLLQRLAALDATPEADFAAAVAKLKADLPGMYAAAMAKAPEAAAAWQAVIGTALVDGFGTAAADREKPVKTPNPAPWVANTRPKRAASPCKGRARPSSNR
jgi:phage gp29-like protein